ncbi:class I SAM-dependent methyltransferase [Pontibacter sp. SGAir0037]|uniref:THUMP-like domain-containing protein n=1 Tax=Pontibacter sp. SGAir0037 TaxID=2571030 RepID=UPI0010CCD136|nr:class I SAM-dependent methyltransferase [Pontibacter sp. SGAir0037]QCR23496.1 hypothetical protein C1N53_14865 [Pontibacter sp. SGAir0037]
MRTFTLEEKEFIQEHLKHDPSLLILQSGRYSNLAVLDLVQQIQARQKAAFKLPTWTSSIDTVFPPTLSVEQTSSEQTAAYKASLVTGDVLIDLTGGFGVDSFFFAKSFRKVIHIEQQPELSEIAAFNFLLLGARNIEAENNTAEAFLEQYSGMADVIFLDPARRGEQKEKLHLLQDCQPDVLHLLPLLLKKSKAVLLKTSPMLDIGLALAQLGKVAKVWVVAVQNECKEVLYLIRNQESDTIARVAVNLLPNGEIQQITFTKEQEETVMVEYLEPATYIYEPNAAILKAGAYKSLSSIYKVAKLHPNSHLYTSQTLIANFPGRTFKCLGTSRYHKKELLAKLPPSHKANITVRNFPESVAAIRKKTGIKEGGEVYLFFTTDRQQKPVVLICQKVFASGSFPI